MRRPPIDGSVSGARRPRLAMLAPLRLRDFRLLWIGLTVSLFGDGIFLVAIAWQVYELTDGPTALAMVGLAMSIPHVALLLAGGVVSDRFDRRRVMVAADALRGVALGVLGALSVTGTLELWHVWVLAGVYGAGTAFFGPAFDAIVPELVPEDQLTQANSIDQFVRPAAWRLAGPAVGGWIIAAWGVGGAFLVDAVTFGVSIGAVLAIRRRPAESDEHSQERSALADVREGFRFVRSHVWLWGTLVAAAFAYLLFMGPQEVLLPLIVKDELGGSAKDLGFILAMGGVGAIGAALVMSHRGSPRRHITFMYLAWTCSTLAVAGYGLARYSWQAMAACFLFNAFESAGTIVWATTKQRLVPGRLLGRVSSLDWFVSIGLLPVSFVLTGPVAGLIGARTTLVAAGLLGAVVTLSFLFLPGMRAIERSRSRAEGDASATEALPGAPIGEPSALSRAS